MVSGVADDAEENSKRKTSGANRVEEILSLKVFFLEEITFMGLFGNKLDIFVQVLIIKSCFW